MLPLVKLQREALMSLQVRQTALCDRGVLVGESEMTFLQAKRRDGGHERQAGRIAFAKTDRDTKIAKGDVSGASH